MDKQKNVMDSVSETYIQTAELINKHIQDKGKRKKLFTSLKNLTIEHEKMETEFNVKQRAHKYVQDKNAQVPDLDIEKVSNQEYYCLKNISWKWQVSWKPPHLCENGDKNDNVHELLSIFMSN